MPRKRSPVPATAPTVLEYFRSVNIETAETILSLVQAEMAERRRSAVPTTTSFEGATVTGTARAPRKPRNPGLAPRAPRKPSGPAPETYGEGDETLADA